LNASDFIERRMWCPFCASIQNFLMKKAKGVPGIYVCQGCIKGIIKDKHTCFGIKNLISQSWCDRECDKNEQQCCYEESGPRKMLP